MANAAEIIAKRLHQAGVRKAWGIPGGEVLTMIKALGETGIEFIMARHENAAGFMAEGTHHATNTPAVLVATIGPGVANAVNFIVNAQQDKVPVIYLTGRVDPKEAAVYTHQVFDHAALLRPISKASLEITDGAVEEIIDKAVAIAMDDPPGPVHVDIPISLAGKPQLEREIKPRVAVRHGTASGANFELAQAWLSEAKKPLMIAGVEALYQYAENDLAEFCTSLGIPLITTYKAKGILSEDHPMSLGGAGLSPKANQVLLPFVQQADVIVLAGYDPIEMRDTWRSPWASDCKIIELTAIPNTHYMHQADISFVCDVGSSVTVLGKKRNQDAESWGGGTIANTRQMLKQTFLPENDWGPARLIKLAREIIPRDAVITADTGAHRILLSQMWECYQARSMIQSSALCTMGCAVPMAVGYKTSKPETPVVAFTGDAGMEMVLGDLATLRDSALPIIIIVFVDASLALIEMKQRNLQYENVGVDAKGDTDFVKIAEAYDLNADWVTDAAGFSASLTKALASDRSTLLACRINRKSYDGKI
ncbi:MAG: thiamine pyrophosphate-binding protein [Gammaproteobacteria bacterium]|nr:thiamine pyrophosphate-binding protein [Gammaproteobacteria bacterium]